MDANLLFVENRFCGRRVFFSGGHKSINEWYYAYDEVDLELIWDVIK